MRENPSRLTVDEVKDLINQGQPVASSIRAIRLPGDPQKSNCRVCIAFSTKWKGIFRRSRAIGT